MQQLKKGINRAKKLPNFRKKYPKAWPMTELTERCKKKQLNWFFIKALSFISAIFLKMDVGRRDLNFKKPTFAFFGLFLTLF